jgi:N-carbamoyl-L-amino-acid hydrolase
MNRRRFTRVTTLGAAGLWMRGAPPLPEGFIPEMSAAPRSVLDGSRGSAQVPTVNGDRLGERMGTLATFGANSDGGIDRVAFSDANIEARDWVAGLLQQAGFQPSTDVAGNLIGRKEGTESGLRPLMFGSHIDSVPGGGNFDGQVGAMGSVEVAQALADAGYHNRHPWEVAFFTNEEGGKTGSRALAGEVEPFELELETASGFTIGEGLRRLGGDPSRLAEARRQPASLEAFLELHVEQGGVLDTDGVDIGVVEGIVGIMRWNVTVQGMTNHAGTTPMDRRQDAMVGAARLITSVHRIAHDMEGRQVATVGRVVAEPGAPNVIPGRVTFSLEIRDLSMEGIERVFDEIRRRASELEPVSGVTYAFERFYVSRAAPTDPRIRDLIEQNASNLGLTTLRMPSGAGHDAQSFATLGPVGMIFVPSVDGISHAPEEHTDLSDIVNGTNVLLRTLLDIDQRGLG